MNDRKRKRWKIPLKDLEIDILCQPEDTPFKGNCMVSGDPLVDHEAEERIRKQLEAGNGWAWCYVVVRVTHPESGIYGEDSLGCCSYKNGKDFIKGGYYQDMVREARAKMEVRFADMKKRERKKPVFVLKKDLVVTRNGRRYFQIVPAKSAQMYSVGHLAQQVVRLLNGYGEWS